MNFEAVFGGYRAGLLRGEIESALRSRAEQWRGEHALADLSVKPLEIDCTRQTWKWYIKQLVTHAPGLVKRYLDNAKKRHIAKFVTALEKLAASAEGPDAAKKSADYMRHAKANRAAIERNQLIAYVGTTCRGK